MESPQQILEFLDRSFESIKMPCFGNLNVDYLSSRLLAFRDEQQWLLVFNSIAWIPAGQGLTTLVECVGNCNLSRNQVQHDFHFDSNRYLVTGQVEYDETLNHYRAIVRGQSIAIENLNIIPHPDLFAEREPDIAIALLENYREDLLATREEYGVFIPEGLTEVLRLDEWHHPNWDCLPSQTESFPAIAEVLFTGDSGLYKPSSQTNTDWRLWYPK